MQIIDGRPVEGQPARVPGLAGEPAMRVLADQAAAWTRASGEPLTWDAARQIIAASDENDGARTDLAVADISTWLVGPHPRTGVASMRPIALPGRPDPGFIELRKSAFSQLCSAIGAPAGYMLRLPARLASGCLSVSLQRLPEDQRGRLLRMAGGQARALASERYAPLDNDMVLDTMERTLRSAGMLADVRVSDLAVGPTMAMRVLLPGEAIPVRAGDVIQHGLDVCNGELTNRSVSVAPVTYRLVCTNGMRRWDRGVAKRWNHVGDPERLRERFREAVPVTLAEAHGLRERMARALDVFVANAIDEIAGLEAFGFSVSETREITRDLYADRGLALPATVPLDTWRTMVGSDTSATAYDVANAITHAAQSRESVDDRLTWEERGGAYTMKRT